MKGIQKRLEIVDSMALVRLESQLQHEYNQITFQEELLWYQKSREKWVKLGDKNTAFFHAQTIIRCKRNKIHGLTLPNGIWVVDDVILQEEAQIFFQSLFCTPALLNPVQFAVSKILSLKNEEGAKLLEPVIKDGVP